MYHMSSLFSVQLYYMKTRTNSIFEPFGIQRFGRFGMFPTKQFGTKGRISPFADHHC